MIALGMRLVILLPTFFFLTGLVFKSISLKRYPFVSTVIELQPRSFAFFIARERSGCMVGSPPKKMTLVFVLFVAKIPSHSLIVDMGSLFLPCCSVLI